VATAILYFISAREGWLCLDSRDFSRQVVCIAATLVTGSITHFQKLANLLPNLIQNVAQGVVAVQFH
jgi:hypothetical protein